MDEQQQQEQAQQQAEARAQEEADFHRAFAETSGTDLPASTAAPVGAAAERGGKDAVTQEASEQQQEEATAAAGTEGQPAQQQPATTEDDDPVEFAGFKRSELRRLLGNAAEVETIKRQLDKAHGSIGDLLRRQQPAPAAPAAPAPAAAPELPPQLRQFEQDYPDVAEYARALVGLSTQQPRQEAPPAQAQQPVATGEAPQAQAGQDPMALELAVLDRMHTGWREKVGSQDFNLWLASQGEQAQQEFAEVATADGMGSLLGKYDQWATARTAAADKAAKGQQRLRAAVTPSGNAPRPQAAPTEEEEFLAAFQATMGQR